MAVLLRSMYVCRTSNLQLVSLLRRNKARFKTPKASSFELRARKGLRRGCTAGENAEPGRRRPIYPCIVFSRGQDRAIQHRAPSAQNEAGVAFCGTTGELHPTKGGVFSSVYRVRFALRTAVFFRNTILHLKKRLHCGGGGGGAGKSLLVALCIT